MSNETAIRIANTDEINEHTQGLIKSLHMLFTFTEPPLISIAAAIAAHCRRVPDLGNMLGRMLAGESADEVHRATSVPVSKDTQLTPAPGAEA